MKFNKIIFLFVFAFFNETLSSNEAIQTYEAGRLDSSTDVVKLSDFERWEDDNRKNLVKAMKFFGVAGLIVGGSVAAATAYYLHRRSVRKLSAANSQAISMSNSEAAPDANPENIDAE